MGKRTETPATTDVLRRAQQLNVDVDITQEQLNRWRNHHVIPTPENVGRGPGEGVGRVYDDQQLDYIVEFARQPRDHLDVIPAAMFFHGHDVPIDCLRVSYRYLLDWSEDYITKEIPEDGDVFDAAEQLARRSQRDRHPAAKEQRRQRRDLHKVHKRDWRLGGYEDEPLSFESFNTHIDLSTIVAGAAPNQLEETDLRHLAVAFTPVVAALTGAEIDLSGDLRRFKGAIVDRIFELRYGLNTLAYATLRQARDLTFPPESLDGLNVYAMPPLALGPLLVAAWSDDLSDQSAVGPEPGGVVESEGENPS